MRFVDISGYGHSGKGVITDLLREFNGYNVPHPNFEFNLLRIQGGLIDLRFSLVDNWSPIRANASIIRFKNLIKRIGPKAKLSKPVSLFYSNGMNYDEYFNGKFSAISNDYINSLISYTYQGDWPYNILDENPLRQFYHRIIKNTLSLNNDRCNINVTAINKESFESKTQSYLNALFDTIKKSNDIVFVMHNALEPFCPEKSLNLFENVKSIIVQRDPRDIYASLYVNSEGHSVSNETDEHWKLKRSFLGADDIDIFCKRQLIQFQQSSRESNSNILRIRYEDIILNYDHTLSIIYNFLGEEPSVHINKKLFFKPELSKKNIGLWMKIEDQAKIKLIENKLFKYCYNG